MIHEAEVARRAAAYFASIRVPAGAVLVPRSTPLAQTEIAAMFTADLTIRGRTVHALGGGPVAIDRRNGAVTGLGTGGDPTILFDRYLREHADGPPPAYADPPPATSPAPPWGARPRGRPTVGLQPKRPRPQRPSPPPGPHPDDPGRDGRS